MRILLISDIHANFPALEAVAKHAGYIGYDLVCNCGDTTVYAPFPNETVDWLRDHKAISILGNTDRKMLALAAGKTVAKPRKPDKRVMYTWTVDVLEPANLDYLKVLEQEATVTADGVKIGLFHGSPEDPDEFLFQNTADDRFRALAKKARHDILCCGHSHSPFYKMIEDRLFINPGAVGRMFDGNPAASYALLEIRQGKITVAHHRIPWDTDKMSQALRNYRLPAIYATMYETGRKLN